MNSLEDKPVPAADDPRRLGEGGLGLVHRLVQGGADVEVQRLADGARLLGPVEHGDGANARGQRGDELLGGEGTVEADGHQPDPFPVLDEGIDRLARRASSRTHEHEDAFGVRSTVVLDQAVPAPGPFCQ